MVIPAFNEEKYLPLCLESLRKQTFKDFEIIVVDNNSTDGTSDIAFKFGASVFKERRQGTSFARKKGFQEAKGEIIARTDADTTVPPDWLEIIYKTFRSESELVGISGTYINSNIFIHIWSFILVNILAKLVMGHILLIGPTTAIRRSSWKKIKTHDDNRFFLEDWDLSCHLSEIGKLKYVKGLTIPLATRRFKTISGLYNYFIKYPAKYLITIWTHHPFFKHHDYFT